MAPIKKGRKTIKQNFYLYNMVIQPEDRQNPEAYINIFKKIFDLRQSIKLSSNYYLRMMSLNYDHDGQGLLSGTFVKYQELKEEGWYNSKTNSFQEVNVDENLHPDGKEIWFYFYPDKHRLVVESFLTTVQVQTYFEKFLGIVTEGSGMSVAFNIVKTKEAISQIATNKHLIKLEITIYYTNSDNFNGWERMLDEDNKKTNVTNLKLTASGHVDKPINVEENKLLMSALTLSRENGYAKAVEHTKNGRKTISSDKSPENIGIKYPEGESVIQLLRNKLFGSVS